MEIGDWKASAEMNETFKQARALGLEGNLAELEAFGFTIVPPEKVAPAGFAEKVLEAVLRIEREEDPSVVDMLNRPQSERPVYGRSVFRLVAKDPIFAEAALNPVGLTLARYLVGRSCHLHNTAALLKRGAAGVTPVHVDSSGFPPPLPPFPAICNVSWILTPYRQETGTFFIVPGSHRFCRHPTQVEQPKFGGGANDDDYGIPVVADPGSLFVFSGNLWHGTYPKTDEGLRSHIAFMYARNYVYPGEALDDVPDEYIERFGEDLAQLTHRLSWQGYHDEGPSMAKLARTRRATQTSAA